MTIGTSPTRHRRRRQTGGHLPPASSSDNDGGNTTNGDPCYSDSDKDVKGNRIPHEDKIHASACSCGQFVLNPCLCMMRCGRGGYERIRRLARQGPATTLPLAAADGNLQKKQRAKQRKNDNLADRLLVIGIIVFSVVCVVCLAPQFWRWCGSPKIGMGRPATDDHVNRIPVGIPCLDFQRWNRDIGNRNIFHRFFTPEIVVDNVLGLPGIYEVEFAGPFGAQRNVRSDDYEQAEIFLVTIHGRNDPMKNYEDYLEYTEDLQDKPNECRRNNWMQLYNPSCNAIHELELSYTYDENRTGLGYDQMFDSFYISHGYWRDVWVVDQVAQGVKSILKTTRYEHEDDIDTFWGILNDALVMERLSKSPRIVDLFGHCGFTVWVEAIPFEVEAYTVPGDGFIKQEELHDETELKPQNNYDEEEKLEKALAMAESIADLHGFEDGLIIHDDIQLCQWLQTRDGNIKLGDFNRAEFPLWNEAKQEYCKYNNGHGGGNYRSPEEFAAKDLDEKIDVFSFGNNIYGLLTGLWVFYEDKNDAVVQKKLMKGNTAYIDDRWRTHSFITSKLVEVMEKCWAYKPEDRIDIFEAVRMLRAAKEEYLQRKQQGLENALEQEQLGKEGRSNDIDTKQNSG